MDSGVGRRRGLPTDQGVRRRPAPRAVGGLQGEFARGAALLQGLRAPSPVAVSSRLG